MTTSPRFTEIEVERGIVREEILEDLDDEGRDVDPDNISRALIYDKHPLGYTITGAIAALDRFDEAALRAHHARHYSGENAVLCVAGRIGDVDRIAALVERSFGAMPRGARVPVSPPPNGQKKPRFRFVENQSSQTDLRIAFRGPSERDPREPAVEMLLRVLDDGMSTRLYERICDRLGLCYDVSGMFRMLRGRRRRRRSRRRPARARRPGSEGDLLAPPRSRRPRPQRRRAAKARDRHLWSIEAMQDDAEGVAGFFGLAALADIARTPMARHEEIMAVSAADVRDAAQSVFRPERLSAVAVGLLTEAEERRLEKAIKGF